MDDRAEDRRLAAHHEAAHAVVAHLLGADVYYMDADAWAIDGDWDEAEWEQERSGYVRFRISAFDLFESVVISVVGDMAEERAGGLKVADTPDDNWTEVEGLPEVWERWERLTGQAPDRAMIVHHARQVAGAILDIRWADIEGVASALLQGESWKDRLEAITP
jgi:hypothetical protein